MTSGTTEQVDTEISIFVTQTGSPAGDGHSGYRAVHRILPSALLTFTLGVGLTGQFRASTGPYVSWPGRV